MTSYHTTADVDTICDECGDKIHAGDEVLVHSLLAMRQTNTSCKLCEYAVYKDYDETIEKW